MRPGFNGVFRGGDLEILYLLIGGVVLIAIGRLLPKGAGDAPAKRQGKRARKAVSHRVEMKQPPDFSAFSPRPAPSQDPSSTIWQPEQLWRQGGKWTILIPNAAVAGAAHYGKNLPGFLKDAKRLARKGARYGLAVEREPNNPADENVVAVFGLLDGTPPIHIGYLSAAKALKLAAVLPTDAPLAAECLGTFSGKGNLPEMLKIRILTSREAYAALSPEMRLALIDA